MNPIKKVKHVFQLWMWRLQQISQPVNMLMLSITLTLTITAYIKWRFENPYIGITLTFLALAGAIGLSAYLWDKKARMWVEQGEVVTERNPYMTFHMTAKEIVSNLTMWVPLYKAIGIEESARIMEDWCKEALKIDPKVKLIADKIIVKFKAEQVIKERYKWYGG